MDGPDVSGMARQVDETMRIAITGGSGFIGTRLRELLEQAGHECVIVDLKHEDPVDILNLDTLTKAFEGCEAVYHLAAEHRDDVFPRSRYYAVNVKGTENVCKAADANGISRVIFTSSFAVYGLDARTPDEQSAPAPFNDYGKSKLEGEQVLQKWSAGNDGARLTIVRPVVVFGEGNRGNVHTLIKQVADNRFLMIGDGCNRKSMAYVGNVAAFLLHCLHEEKRGQVYNYADAPDLSMNELMAVIYRKLGRTRPSFSLPFAAGMAAGYGFDLLARLTGKTFPVSAVRVQKFCADTTCNATKSRSAGFSPPHTLSEGIERMIAHDFADKVRDGKKVLMVVNDIAWFWSHRLPLAREILAQGYDLHLATNGAAENAQIKALGITGHDLPEHTGSFNPVGQGVLAFRIFQVLRIVKPDLVHAITLRHAFFTGIISRVLKCPHAVFTIAGLGSLFTGDDFKVKTVRHIIVPLFKFAFGGQSRFVIVQNPDDQRALIQCGAVKEARCRVIRGSGVDPVQFPFTREPETERPVVLFCSRLLKSKGICEFVHAARIVKSKGIPARFQVAGDLCKGNHDSISEGQLETWKSEGTVEFLGHQADMPALMAASSLVVLPSYYGEGVPKVLLEAAATGRAIVTTDMPGCRETVEDGVNGFLVEPKNAWALADALEKLLLDADLRQLMGENGRRRIEAGFTVAQVNAATVEVYEEMKKAA